MSDQSNNDKENGRLALSERVQNCLSEVCSLVRKGIEHPRFEFKRTASITREDLDDRLDFIKLLQGVANADGSEERYVVIGGDPKEKKFYPVPNAAEFDPARVCSVLSKYLDPLPEVEVFNGLVTEDEHPIVLFIFSPKQSRPITVKTEGKKVDGKIRLQIGDIWIKKGTALQLATRNDLDLIYQQKMEEQIEDRARKRFKHLVELSGTSLFVNSAVMKMPARELLVGPKGEFKRFCEELIATNDKPRFSMLVEIVRESLIESWDKHDITASFSPAFDIQKYAEEINDFYRDEFSPSLQAMVSLGIFIIKYDFHGEWLNSIVNVLLEGFEKCRSLQRLKSAHFAQLAKLSWWRPAFEAFIALKTIAIYAVLRDRPRFLDVVLQRFVVPLSIDNQPAPEIPVLFWPFRVSMFMADTLQEGRATFLWNDRIASLWGEYFGNVEQFLGAACQLEFLLEFNSHLGINPSKDPQLQQWLDSNARDLDLSYLPDLYIYKLDPTIPMAERLYDIVLQHDGSPSQWEILTMLFAAAFNKKTKDQRIFIYGGFLDGLKSWQSNIMMQQFQRFPFMFTWPPRLADAVAKYRAQKTKTQ